MAGMEGVSLETMANHVVKLGEEISQLKNRNQRIETELMELKGKMDDDDMGGGRGRQMNREKSELRSVKRLYPSKWSGPDKEHFKSWAEDFEEWIRAEDNELADMLHAAGKSKVEIGMPMDKHATDARLIHST